MGTSMIRGWLWVDSGNVYSHEGHEMPKKEPRGDDESWDVESYNATADSGIRVSESKIYLNVDKMEDSLFRRDSLQLLNGWYLCDGNVFRITPINGELFAIFLHPEENAFDGCTTR